MSHVQSQIEQLATTVRERLEPAVYDYFAGGSGQEISLAEAPAAWSRFRLVPRVLRDVSSVDIGVDLLGTRLPGPVGLAPVAFQGLLHDSGEIATAQGAGNHLVVVSTRASRTIEEIAAVAGAWWFQVYVTVDRSLTVALIRRAAAAGAQALVLTADTPYVARKARAGRPSGLGSASNTVNFAPHLQPGADPVVDTEQNPSVTFEDIGWLARESGLPVLVKGVLRADDAGRCLDAGAAGLIVSNHGGRQLDRSIATALALRDVVAAAGDAPVLVDGGVRSGLDVLIALALGARAVLVGRPAAWALAAGGPDGVERLLAALDDEFAHVLGLAGCTCCADVTPDLVRG